MGEAKAERRRPVGVRLDPDVHMLVRMHSAKTRENVSDLLNRLIREEFEAEKPKPAA
jgi:hypothetical protein